MNCKVIATHKKADGRVIALLEKSEDSPEKYIVAVNYDAATKSWGHGIYSRDLLEAMEDFVRIARS